MGNKKISELPVTTTLTDNDIIPVVNTDGTKKVSVDTLQNKVKTKYNIPNDVNAALSTLQPKSDASLSTSSHTVVGAINEINDWSLAVVDGKLCIKY